MEPRKGSIAGTFGLIAGACLIVLTFIQYKAGVEVYLGPARFLGYAILLGMAVAAALAQKRSNGRTLEFREALQTCFRVFVIGLALQTLFAWLLLNVIDTHFKEVLTRMDREIFATKVRRLGFPHDKTENMIAEEFKIDEYSLSRMLLGLAMTCIASFVFALLISAIVKKKKQPTGQPANAAGKTADAAL